MSRDTSEIKKETSPDTVEGNESSKNRDKKEKSPIKRMTLIVFICCLLLLVWYLLSNRYTPYSDNSRMNALVVPIVPKVSGYLKVIKVRLHSEVKANDTLFQIDQKMYDLAVKSAEANIEKATQQMGIEGADIKSAAGRLGVAKAQLDRAQRNYDRVNSVLVDNPDALSQYDRDAAETALSTAMELVLSAQADLEKAKQQLGHVGAENVNLKMALTSYELARLNLYYSTLKAPSDGIIESFNLGKGHYCVPGQALTTLISTNDVWIQAAFSENSIENIKIGDKVDFILDVAPGRIFKGRVRSLGAGVSSDQALIRGQLPNIKTKSGWLRPPQKFPVIIAFSDEDKKVMKHFKLGGQADVVVYTGNHSILNSIAKFRIWINSKLSYVR